MKLVVSLSALILGASSALPAAPPATAATIVRNGDRIVLTGQITAFDDIKFRAALDDNVKTVILGSDGGYVAEAMEIGRIIRQRQLDTAVPSNCASACALIWAGGVKRTVDGRLAMHCPTFPGELQCYAPTRRMMIAYLREMGAPIAVVELQEAAGSTSPLWVEPAQLLTEAAHPVADASDYATPPSNEEYAPPPPRPRRYVRPPPPYPPYGPPPVAPGFIELPGGRIAPCALMIIGLPVCL